MTPLLNVDTALTYAAGCVRGSEGFAAAAYLDTLAKPPVWTLGFGTTRIDGAPVRQGMCCTRDEALAWSAGDMRSAAEYVLAHVSVPLNDWQLAAMISFCYNIGDGNFARSTVRNALNQGYYSIAADNLLDYDEAGGRVYAGLETRRQRERALMLIGGGAIDASQLSALRSLPVEPVALDETDLLNQQELDRLNKGQAV